MTPGYYAKRAYVRGVRGGVSDLYGHLSLGLDRLTATKRHGWTNKIPERREKGSPGPVDVLFLAQQRFWGIRQ
jgi:hypothetical protein